MSVIRLEDIRKRKAALTSMPESEALVYDLRAVVNGEARFFIIKVLASKRAAFLWAVKQDAGLRLEDFGVILFRGWDEPADDLKERLRQEYGMDYPASQ